MFGSRQDPLQNVLNWAYRTRNELIRASAPADKLEEAHRKIVEAQNAIRTRDLERKKTRARNALLRSQGIDPSKKPQSMSTEQFNEARRTLRKAIDPQFPAYKAEMFRILRARVDSLIVRLAEANGDAILAAFGPKRGEMLEKAGLGSYGLESRIAHNAIQNCRESLAEFHKWTRKATQPDGDARRNYRAADALDIRAPISDAEIDMTLDKEAHTITEHDFESYAQKLAGKIGKRVALAKVFGNLWQSSELHVVIARPFREDSPEVQREMWTTKMILNFSARGTPYNQWPTRQIS